MNLKMDREGTVAFSCHINMFHFLKSHVHTLFDQNLEHFIYFPTRSSTKIED